ncbi:hypothetical protein SNEBB_002106 [Seison nebaliae]|nr:hypothetical protein SNEBB_002106 [Seison nebaliae]
MARKSTAGKGRTVVTPPDNSAASKPKRPFTRRQAKIARGLLTVENPVKPIINGITPSNLLPGTTGVQPLIVESNDKNKNNNQRSKVKARASRSNSKNLKSIRKPARSKSKKPAKSTKTAKRKKSLPKKPTKKPKKSAKSSPKSAKSKRNVKTRSRTPVQKRSKKKVARKSRKTAKPKHDRHSNMRQKVLNELSGIPNIEPPFTTNEVKEEPMDHGDQLSSQLNSSESERNDDIYDRTPVRYCGRCHKMITGEI